MKESKKVISLNERTRKRIISSLLELDPVEFAHYFTRIANDNERMFCYEALEAADKQYVEKAKYYMQHSYLFDIDSELRKRFSPQGQESQIIGLSPKQKKELKNNILIKYDSPASLASFYNNGASELEKMLIDEILNEFPDRYKEEVREIIDYQIQVREKSSLEKKTK